MAAMIRSSHTRPSKKPASSRKGADVPVVDRELKPDDLETKKSALKKKKQRGKGNQR